VSGDFYGCQLSVLSHLKLVDFYLFYNATCRTTTTYLMLPWIFKAMDTQLRRDLFTTPGWTRRRRRKDSRVVTDPLALARVVVLVISLRLKKIIIRSKKKYRKERTRICGERSFQGSPIQKKTSSQLLKIMISDGAQRRVSTGSTISELNQNYN
jgi:hypothetical protein